MATDSQTGARAPRLNPFVFPSSTDFRFALLIVSVLGASAFIYNWVYFDFPANREHALSTYVRCWDAASAAHPTDPFAQNVAFNQCIAPVDRIQAAWIIGGVALLLIVAGLIYWFLPARKIWRSRLVPLSAEDAPDVVAYLADLCREAGLSRPPVFVWNPLNPASSGLAFGRLGRYYVALTGGLVTQFYTNRPAFRAVMLHELAHLRNGDVNKTYFTVAIWQAFVVAALLPLIVSLLFGGAWSYLFDLGWRVLVLTGLVYLTRNAVLRVREMYADVRASVWDDPAGALSRVLEALPQPKVGRWRTTLQVHPDPSQRRQVLDDTRGLFRMGFWDAFGTGIATTIAFANIVTLLSLLTSTQDILAPLVAALIFTPLAVGVVGLGSWRATFATLAQGGVPRGAGHLGLSLALGFILGQTLSFSSFIEVNQVSGQTDLIGLVSLSSFDILWSALLLASLFFFFRWVAAGASVWLEVAATGRSPRLAYGVGLTVAGVLLAVWFGLLFLIRDVRVILPSLLSSFDGVLGVVWLLVQHPLTFLVLISLWAFPLAAWFWRERVASAPGSSWAFLDPTPQPLTLPRQAPLRPGLALTVGLAGGLAFCVVLLVLRVAVRLTVPEATATTDQFKLMYYIGQVALAALMEAGVAAVVAGWVKRLGGLHGLFAAFVAGCVMTGGVLGLNLLFGGTIDFAFTWQTFSQVVNEGALLALPTALGVSALAGWVRRFGGQSARVPGP
ncbi:MAG: M48 family metalloprotease [Anaerolineae bacterium]